MPSRGGKKLPEGRNGSNKYSKVLNTSGREDRTEKLPCKHTTDLLLQSESDRVLKIRDDPAKEFSARILGGGSDKPGDTSWAGWILSKKAASPAQKLPPTPARITLAD